MIDLHSATLTLNGETLRVKSGSVRADESWSPYVQADLVCPIPANIEAVDPREDVRALVTLRRDFGTPFTNRDLTRAVKGYAPGAEQRRNIHANPIPIDRTGYGTANGSTVTFNADKMAIQVDAPASTVQDVGVSVANRGTGDQFMSLEIEAETAGTYRLVGLPTGWSGDQSVTLAAGEARRIAVNWNSTTDSVIYAVRTDNTKAQRFYVRKVLRISGSRTPDPTYFDGSLPVSATSFYSWLGSPGRSASVERQRIDVNASNADLSAAWSNYTNSKITTRFFEPYGATIREAQVAEFNLAVRARRVNHVTQELSLTLASDEKRLQDYALLQTVPYTNFTTSLRALVGDILSRVGGSLEPGEFDAVIAEAGTSWTPGATAWDYLSPHIEKADGRLWCDASRRWHLGPRESLAPGQLTLTTGANGTLTRAEDSIDRSGDAWADAVVVAYKWTDAEGAQQTAYDVAGDASTARKVMTLTREQPFPGAGAAAAILKRSEDRGRVLALTAVSDYTVQPGQAFMATLPGTPALTGVVSAIAWDLTGFEMTVDTRGLLDTPATAWSFQPAGRTWNSVPTGTDWTEV